MSLHPSGWSLTKLLVMKVATKVNVCSVKCSLGFSNIPPALIRPSLCFNHSSKKNLRTTQMKSEKLIEDNYIHLLHII